MLDKLSGWFLQASGLEMTAEGGPYRLEALGQTPPPTHTLLELWTSGAVEP